jgi:hypothetical protein
MNVVAEKKCEEKEPRRIATGTLSEVHFIQSAIL